LRGENRIDGEIDAIQNGEALEHTCGVVRHGAGPPGVDLAASCGV
jgi:hypothetical protein